MRYLQKCAAPESYVHWQAQANDDWQPGYADLQNPQKAHVHLSLLVEQGWVCCYCGRRITQESSHIEHFLPQERYPDDALEYENLHASCIRETNPGTPLHCGHYKGNVLDKKRALSPTDRECEQKFRYALDGQIIPAGDKAIYMRDLLRLDIEFLKDRRAEVLQGVFDNDFLLDATADELTRLREEYVQRREDGQLPDFGHVVARYAEQLLQSSAA